MKLNERFQAYHGELACPDSSIVHDALTGDTVADFPSHREACDSPLARRQAARAEFLARTLNTAPRITVGMTVTTSGVERFPHFNIPDGATGVVVEIFPGGDLWVHMDDHVPGCEEWSNEVQVSCTNYVEEFTALQAFALEFTPTGYAEYHVSGMLPGHTCDLACLLEQDLPHDEAMALRGLRVGESVTLGGGAFATSVVTRCV